jgi:hypothetical protein
VQSEPIAEWLCMAIRGSKCAATTLGRGTPKVARDPLSPGGDQTTSSHLIINESGLIADRPDRGHLHTRLTSTPNSPSRPPFCVGGHGGVTVFNRRMQERVAVG